MTQARLVPRMTAWPCAIIMSSVTGSVVGMPYSTMPRLSPTSSRSACASSSRAIGVV